MIDIETIGKLVIFGINCGLILLCLYLIADMFREGFGGRR